MSDPDDAAGMSFGAEQVLLGGLVVALGVVLWTVVLALAGFGAVRGLDALKLAAVAPASMAVVFGLMLYTGRRHPDRWSLTGGDEP